MKQDTDGGKRTLLEGRGDDEGEGLLCPTGSGTANEALSELVLSTEDDPSSPLLE